MSKYRVIATDDFGDGDSRSLGGLFDTRAEAESAADNMTAGPCDDEIEYRVEKV